MTQVALFDDGTAPANADLSQWYTDPSTARTFVRWALRAAAVRHVLEPSAGNGSLVRAILDHRPDVTVEAIEIEQAKCESLRARFARERVGVTCARFEHYAHEWKRLAPAPFCASVMNPPYEGDLDMLHVELAAELSMRACALVRLAFFAGQGRHAFWRWHELTRAQVFSTRPKYHGPKDLGAMQDYVGIEVVRRATPVATPVSCPVMEWVP